MNEWMNGRLSNEMNEWMNELMVGWMWKMEKKNLQKDEDKRI